MSLSPWCDIFASLSCKLECLAFRDRFATISVSENPTLHFRRASRCKRYPLGLVLIRNRASPMRITWWPSSATSFLRCGLHQLHSIPWCRLHPRHSSQSLSQPAVMTPLLSSRSLRLDLHPEMSVHLVLRQLWPHQCCRPPSKPAVVVTLLLPRPRRCSPLSARAGRECSSMSPHVPKQTVRQLETCWVPYLLEKQLQRGPDPLMSSFDQILFARYKDGHLARELDEATRLHGYGSLSSGIQLGAHR